MAEREQQGRNYEVKSMKQNWTYKKLGEVATFINGYPFKPDEWMNSGLPIIRIQNLNNPDAAFNYYDGEIDSRYFVHNGDVLISWSGTLGVYEWMKDDALLNQHIFKVVFDKSDIDKGFFKYAVSSRIDEMKGKVHGITMQHITKKEFDTTTIPLPPLSTQSRIVSELDLLQSIIDKQKAQLKELDTLAQSIFYDMFGDPVENEKGWEVKKLGEIALVKIGPFGSLLHTSDYISGGIPLVNPIHMKNGYIKPDYGFTISEEKKKEMLPYLLKKGDVVFARRGEIGRCAIVSEKEDGYLCGTGSLFVRFIKPISEVFVLYLTKSDSFIKDLVSKAKGATMLNINCKIVEGLQIPIPPLSLQQTFAQKIESIERQKELIIQSIREAQTLFDSRMEYYFGE